MTVGTSEETSTLYLFQPFLDSVIDASQDPPVLQSTLLNTESLLPTVPAHMVLSFGIRMLPQGAHPAKTTSVHYMNTPS